MTSQPEKIFRDKLENFQRTAPVAAWERIEANLNKTTARGYWMKIAAAILVLAVTGFIVWMNIQSEGTKTLTESTPIVPKKNVEKSKDEVASPSVAKEHASETKTAYSKKKVDHQNTESRQSLKNTNEIDNKIMVDQVEIPQPAEVVVAQHTEAVPSKTIVYTAEEVNTRFLKKKATDEATPEEKKSSGIQKLMGLAYDLKNNNGLGELRQKKDEILALNFLNKKDETEKEKN